MNGKCFSIAALTAFASALFSFSGCGHNQDLVSIQVTPSPVVFQGVGARVQFTALGTYIHPPEVKDITTKVQWRIDISFLATIDQTGVATAISTCGAGNAIATMFSDPSNPSSGSAIVGSAAISGIDQGTAKCQQ